MPGVSARRDPRPPMARRGREMSAAAGSTPGDPGPRPLSRSSGGPCPARSGRAILSPDRNRGVTGGRFRPSDQTKGIGMDHRRKNPARRTAARGVAAGTGGLLVALMLPATAAVAQTGGGCENRSNDTYEELLDCVTLEGVREHQQAFQEIADKSDDAFYPGTRAAGTEGYEDSVEYVADLLEKAGYEVTLDEVEFEFDFPAVLRQLTPVEAEYETGVFTGSGSGDRRGPGDPDRHQPGGRPRPPPAAARPRTSPDFDFERPGRHRAGPARHLLLRDEGLQRRAGGRRGGHHLQPGQHPRPRGAVRRRTPRASTSRSRAHPDRSRTASPSSAPASTTASRWPRRARRPS